VTRILRNEKYIGKWVWNKTETRRDPKTGRRRKFPKPLDQWIVQEDESFGIVPQALWDQVQKRLEETHSTWPGGKGRRGFEMQRGGRVRQYPTHLLSGSMVCAQCGAAMAQVRGKSGGYYGCLGAAKGACDNKLLTRRTLAERVIVAAVREKLASTESIEYVLRRVEVEIEKTYSDIPETIRMKELELQGEERRVANFVEFIGEGRGSRALAEALTASEQRNGELRAELAHLRQQREVIFKAPPRLWIEERVATLQKVLE
jgi:hypothetical protein